MPAGNAKLVRKTAQQLHANHYLCGAHFETNYFTNKDRNRLQRNAVPTLFKCEDLPDEVMREAPWFTFPDAPLELSIKGTDAPDIFFFTSLVSSPQPSTSTNPSTHQTPPHTIISPKTHIIQIFPSQPTISQTIDVIQKSPGFTFQKDVPPGPVSSSPEKRKRILEEELLDLQELAPDEKLSKIQRETPRSKLINVDSYLQIIPALCQRIVQFVLWAKAEKNSEF
ncbi:Proline--tRNA ligase [Frankliniella fusca]|uniref:Proline--tRNA ligase n=1 Tax=Frankliniella fusca TaxID=407009 RepID=A0AAE1GQ83_9NEOP|nr:Proline--tRNA ligase [Frankliniella fusca]